MTAIQDELVAALGAESVLIASDRTAPFLEDWRKRYQGQAACVVLPRTTGDVAKVVEICDRHDHAIVPQGGNTGLSGGAVSLSPRTVVINLRRMDKILNVDPVEGSMTVEAGCLLTSIHDAAETAGWMFPLRLGSEGSCQIGGNISTNAGGTAVVRYGNTRDLVLGIEAVLPDGSVFDGMRALRKNNSGFDLKHLFIGAEGTLGIVTKAIIRLFPKPKGRALAFVALDSAEATVTLAASARSALDTAVAAIEVMNAEQLRLVLLHEPALRPVFPDSYPYVVLLELAGMEEDEVLETRLSEFLASHLETGLVIDAVQASSLAQMQAIWALRHGVGHANRAEGMGITMDAAVPVSHVAAFIRDADAAIAAEFPEAKPVIVSHLGDGNVHYIAMVPAAIWAGIPDKAGYTGRVRHRINDIAVLNHGGTFSAEHGVGLTLVPEVTRYKSATESRLLSGIKAMIDPKGMMNPGKLLPKSPDPG